MSEIETKLLDKIKKLITLAKDKGASEHEAATAMSMANKLLLMHNLTMADVQLLNDAKFEKKENAIVIGEGHHEGSWEDTLMATICKFNLCASIIHRTAKQRRASMTIIGAKANVEVVLYLFDVARLIYRALASKRYSEYSKKIADAYKPYGYKRKDLYKLKQSDLFPNGSADRVLERRGVWRPQYLKGCVSGLRLKLKEQQEELIAEQYDGKFELMIVDNLEEVVQFMNDEYEGLEDGKKQKMPTRKQAFSDGVVDGKNTELIQGLNTANNENQITQ